MKALYTFEEALNNPFIDTKAFMIPDVDGRGYENLLHYVRLMGLTQYVEVKWEPTTRSAYVKYRIEDFPSRIVPTVEVLEKGEPRFLEQEMKGSKIF